MLKSDKILLRPLQLSDLDFLFEIENKEKYEIRNWDVVSLCNELVVKCSCGKLAKYCYGDIVCCKKHCKDIEYPIIPKELELQKLKPLKNYLL
jgi:hypothetical protein